MTPSSQSKEELTALADELERDYPAVDVTAVVFSRDFAGVGCCVIPQDRVLAIVTALRALPQEPATGTATAVGDWVDEAPADPVKAFAYLVSKCASGLYLELIEAGRTDTQARNQIIHYFLDFAAGEACRIAHREKRAPRPEKWADATTSSFERAIKRTALASNPLAGRDEA